MARAQTFNLYVNMVDGVVPGERVAVIKEYQRPSKAYMDGLSEQGKYAELDRCIELTNGNFQSLTDKGARIFGVSVVDAVSRLAKELQEELALR